MEAKRSIRKSALMLRDSLTEQERKAKSKIILEKVIATTLYKEAEIILTYLNFKSEVETDGLVRQAFKEGKKVYCPKVNGNTMDFYRILSLEDTVIGNWGIREPLTEEAGLLQESEINGGKCLMIMPGSAFDKDMNRIGYGRGYYDKYLNRYPHLFTIAVCFDCQMVEGIPSGEFDIKPNMVITETESVIT